MVSENTQKVLDYLKDHAGEMFTKEQLAEALGINVKAITPMVNYWASERGGNLVARSEPQEVKDAEGNSKQIKYISYVG